MYVSKGTILLRHARSDPRWNKIEDKYSKSDKNKRRNKND